jgi:paraquat-inducible protein B
MASWHPKRVGGFVLAGVALLVAVVVLVGSGSLFSRKHTFVSYFTGSVAGLRIGAPVKLRGIVIGQVTGVYLTLSNQVDVTRVPVIYEIDEELVRRRGGAGERIGDADYQRELIDQGLRAALELESFVTGQRYVELDFHPDAPLEFAQEPDERHPEIPAIQSPGLEQDLTAFVKKLQEADIAGLFASLSHMAARADSTFRDMRMHELRDAADSVLVAAAEAMRQFTSLSAALEAEVPTVGDQLNATADRLATTLDEMNTTLRTTRAALDPASPAAVRLEQSLREIAATARSLRELLEYLQRNPSSLLRGRAEEGQP